MSFDLAGFAIVLLVPLAGIAAGIYLLIARNRRD